MAFGTDPERERSRAMVRATFEAVLGTFARRLLRVGADDALRPAALDALREWCTRWVTGGAPLPTLAVGPQPYGVLPVCRSAPAQQPETTAELVQQVVSLLAGEWRRAAGTVPVMDPGRIDALADGEHESAVATILATQPHPARLFLRWLDEYASRNDFEDLLTPQAWYQLVLASFDPDLNPGFGPPVREIAQLFGTAIRLDPIGTIAEQLAVWQSVREDLPGLLSSRDLFHLTEEGLGTVDAVLGLLEGWQRRQKPIESLDLIVYEGVLGEENTALVEGVLSQTATEWGEVGIVQARDAGPGLTAADYLADLRDRLADRGATLPPSGLGEDFLAQPGQPLLYQLLDSSLHLVPDDHTETERVRAALDLLATRTPDELEWLLRECLGLGTHRLDAWATSLATQRLSRLRDARPAGIQVGAFGWVVGLAPRTSERSSAGFVHAPSMAHAATAAVLRSGWLAHGSDDPLAPAAVDVRSHRLRAAAWLFEGVRQGQDLGDLLGHRFERALHDLGADQHIRPIRAKVLAAAGQADVPPDEPVDGVELLDLDRADRLGVVAAPVRTALDRIESAFDAANDVGLFEAVHQLTGANLERATAMLDALVTGTSAPPELQAPRTPRASVGVEHRVLVLLDPAAPHPGRGWTAAGDREALAPALGAWVASLLPDAGTVGFTARPVRAVDGGDEPPGELTLKDLGLSALDALWLVGEDPEVVPAALTTLAAGALAPSAIGSARMVSIDPAARGQAAVALREFTVLAIELRRAIEALRVADARDLRPAHTPGEADADEGAALGAAGALVATFARLLERLGEVLQAGKPGEVIGVVERMARLGIATGRAPGDLAAAAELQALASQRLRRVAAVPVDPDDRRSGLEGRVAALLGGRVPLLARFPLTGGAVDVTTALAGDAEVDDWLDAAGRVRADLGRLVTAGMLSELLDPSAGLRAAAGQTPAEAGEGWAATALPAPGTGGRLSLVAVTGPGGPPLPGAAACGLVVDRWSEQIPGAEQVTGVTFQFDAPGNRRPQSWLLAVPPEGQRWSLMLVLDTLLETLEWATLRAVAPEDLLDFGRAIPTVFVPGSIVAWPQEGT